MRILEVNKFNYPSGGAEKYFLSLTAALKDAGHETAIFCMADKRNEGSHWQKYFVSHIDFYSRNLLTKLKTPGRIIYSREAKRKFAHLLDDFKPDIIHLHNIYHQISPSILPEAKKRGVPVVMHLHDYKLACPNYRLFVNNKICTACLDKKTYQPCIRKNCYGSFSRSYLAYLEMLIHHDYLHIYEKNIDLLIAPSEFIKNIMIKAGWPSDKIIVLYNPAPLTQELNQKEEKYFLYFGRLTKEKGVADLIGAIKKTDAHLKIAGDGPQVAELKILAAPEIKTGKIEFLGQLAGAKLTAVIKNAQAIVFPSRWPENMPLALLESLAQGKIVITSRVGGLPEIIKDKDNGFLFAPGEIDELTQKIKMIEALKPKDREPIKIRALETAQKLNPQKHLSDILKIYLKLVKKSE